MSDQLHLFVSHSHQDDAFARDLAGALRAAGADVWYDEDNLGSGQLGPVIEHELRARPIFILVLSPAALTSRWVEDECRWAYNRLRRDPTRTILPVTAAPLADEDDIWLFLQDFKRVEAPGVQPYPKEEAIRRTLHALALTPKGEAPASTAPQPAESAEELVTRGKALQGQRQHAEAVRLFQRATQLAPDSFDAWFNLGYSLHEMKHPEEALVADEQALTIQPNDAPAWNNKGLALYDLKRYPEALAAYERALALDANNAFAWNGKGNALRDLKRPEEALAAYERAIALDPTYAPAWRNMAKTLNDLKRYPEALAAAERALTLEPASRLGWIRKAEALRGLGRIQEADEAAAKANTLGG